MAKRKKTAVSKELNEALKTVKDTFEQHTGRKIKAIGKINFIVEGPSPGNNFAVSDSPFENITSMVCYWNGDEWECI